MPQRRGQMWYVALPAGTASIELSSPAVTAWYSRAARQDERRLGVALGAAALVTGRCKIALDLSDSAHEGVYEPADGAFWTDGAARLRLPACTGPAVLELKVIAAVRRFEPVTDGCDSAQA
jgi:hypothetical protein